MQPLELVKLKDVVIEFTQAEWVMLDSSQRRLFRDVMLENISNMFSVGYQVCESDVASKLVQGEELCEEGIGFFQNQNSGVITYWSLLRGKHFGESFRTHTLRDLLKWRKTTSRNRFEMRSHRTQLMLAMGLLT
ncbi:putative zinc finger protein 705EP isoform X2 [Tamandua tetradactyla]|uniref:putative zinc finger protein 705EP isoform X2 n=1 Tax=Tamandua tetradactyla TaxID=48850 RepID=UPI004053D0C9